MISLIPDDQQLELIEAADDYFIQRLPLSRVRELAVTGDGVGEAVWQDYADMGWLAIAIPEERGGVGLSLIEEALLLVEAGRHLAPGPLQSTMLAARIASEAGDAALADRLASGGLRAGVLVGDRAIGADVGDLVLSLTADSAMLSEIVEATRLEPVDPNTPLVRVARASEVLQTTGSYLSQARLGAAAQLLGVLEAVRDQSAAYARLRVQFGRPIGAFQAVKHRCAAMAIAAYAVRAQVSFATVCLEAGTSDAEHQTSMALALAATSTLDSAKDNILNHGGIGFTWEADAHLYLKRALLLGRLYGTEQALLADVLDGRASD